MKLRRMILIIFTSITMVLTMATAETKTTKGKAMNYIDDSVITTKVKASILGETSLTSSEIKVETLKGIVQLSGFVASQENIDKATTLTKAVNGVTSVKNDIQLKSKDTKDSAGQYVDDSLITTKVSAILLKEMSLESAEINVKTLGGVVQLSGFVSSEANIQKAIEITSKVKDVVSVKNDMRLK